jgi:hypothetical protein
MTKSHVWAVLLPSLSYCMRTPVAIEHAQQVWHSASCHSAWAASTLLVAIVSWYEPLNSCSTCRVNVHGRNMISSCLLVATAILASFHTAMGQETQLDMARKPQPVQRAEFPLVGEESAFKFSFVNQGVRKYSVACVHACACSPQWGEELLRWFPRGVPIDQSTHIWVLPGPRLRWFRPVSRCPIALPFAGATRPCVGRARTSRRVPPAGL